MWVEIPCVIICDKTARKELNIQHCNIFMCSAGMAETMQVTATQRQANVGIGEEEAGVNIGTRFWNLTSGQERGAVVPYVDPKKSLGKLAPSNVLPAIQKAIIAMNTDSRFMVLFRLARSEDKHILEFKHGEPNRAKNENWSAL
jgi:hypothetical protein